MPVRRPYRHLLDPKTAKSTLSKYKGALKGQPPMGSGAYQPAPAYDPSKKRLWWKGTSSAPKAKKDTGVYSSIYPKGTGGPTPWAAPSQKALSAAAPAVGAGYMGAFSPKKSSFLDLPKGLTEQPSPSSPVLSSELEKERARKQAAWNLKVKNPWWS